MSPAPVFVRIPGSHHPGIRLRLIPGFRDPGSVLILGQVTQYGNPYLICIARYLHVTYTSGTRWMLVWHDGTRSHMVWNHLGNVTNTVSTWWAVGFETLDTCLKHVVGWLTGAHVQFWTCLWFSHTVFTRSRHTSRCDCALSKTITYIEELLSVCVSVL